MNELHLPIVDAPELPTGFAVFLLAWITTCAVAGPLLGAFLTSAFGVAP